MSAYGWTLPQTLQLTVPQAYLLLKSLGKYPVGGLLSGGIIGGLSKKSNKPVESLGMDIELVKDKKAKAAMRKLLEAK